MSVVSHEDADLWSQCLEKVLEAHKHIDDVDQINLLTYVHDDGDIALYAPNQAVWSAIKDHHFSTIKETLQSIAGPCKVRLLCKKNGEDRCTNVGPSTYTSLGAYNRLDEAFVFDNFVCGKSNEYAYAGAQHVLKSENGANSPFLIYGDAGIGKTHLATATAHALLMANPSLRILFIPSEKFINDFLSCVKTNKMDVFKSFYRQANVLLIDDIQFLAGKPGTQLEFFHTFNDLLSRKQQIIMTCDCLPNELSGIEDRLKSRLSSGLAVGIKPPGLETRIAILKKKADVVGATLPDEVAAFVAKHVFSNVRELEGALKRVLAHAQFTGQDLTCQFAQHVLQDLLSFKARKISIENIKQVVGDYYRIKTAELVGKKRSREIVKARQVAMFCCKQLTELSLPEIGYHFGRRDHTTVIHSVDKIKNAIDKDLALEQEIESIMRLLNT